MTTETTVKRITRPDDLMAVFPRWESGSFASGASAPMQSRIWVEACVETLARDQEPYVVIVEDDRGVAAIAPLCRRAGAPATAEFIGAGALGEPADFIYRDEAALASLIEVISREGVVLDLQRLARSSPTVAAIAGAFRDSAAVRIHDARNCPRIVIPSDVTDAEHLLPSRLRSDLRRAQRRAELHGEVTYEIVSPRTVQEFIPLFEEALEVEASGWKGARGTALAKNEAQRDFFRCYGAKASEAGALRIAFMRVGAAAAAMQYAVEGNGAYWLLKVGFNETYAKCSPGQLLLRRTLGYAVEKRLRSYEFLGVEEEWTRRWTNTALGTVRVMVYPYNAPGMIALSRDLLTSQWNKAATIFAPSGTRTQRRVRDAAGARGGG